MTSLMINVTSNNHCTKHRVSDIFNILIRGQNIDLKVLRHHVLTGRTLILSSYIQSFETQLTGSIIQGYVYTLIYATLVHVGLKS